MGFIVVFFAAIWPLLAVLAFGVKRKRYGSGTSADQPSNTGKSPSVPSPPNWYVLKPFSTKDVVAKGVALPILV
ncbi:hypothetical protein GURASL_05490 [Geotalea uraniireducens]|uniref:Uncharacterized protein n=1 Tax=Geotalea uraniireducens TaxID=351604 RepID=A0ABM8EGT5_9BACT|nr:hypothetical protein GURASL_05490 [Geotalea uraniireducens]